MLQSDRCRRALLPEKRGDEPAAPRELPLNPSGVPGAGLRHQRDAGTGWRDDTSGHGLITLIGSPGAQPIHAEPTKITNQTKGRSQAIINVARAE
jgi:hypothetical protein